MKRETTKHEAPTSRLEMEKAWKKCWQNLDQGRIHVCIERIVGHIQEVIKDEGGNGYREGAKEKQRNFAHFHPS